MIFFKKKHRFKIRYEKTSSVTKGMSMKNMDDMTIQQT